MEGWRCQIGLIVPMDNAIIEPELYSNIPYGVTINTTRLDTEELQDMPDNAAEKVGDLASLGVDVIAYACNASSFYGGVDEDSRIATMLEDASGVPTTTASTAMVEALDAVGAESIAVVTPYDGKSNQRLEEFLRGNGFEISALSGLGLAPDETDDLALTNSQTAKDTYRRAVKLNADNADAVLVTATNLASLATLPQMEADIGKPVISTNQALLWHSLILADVDPTVSGLGSLLSPEEQSKVCVRNE